MSTISRTVTRVAALPATLAQWENTGVEFDYAVGGVPLIAAPSSDNPYARKTAPYRKDQIDQSDSPGEQSLVFWWMRSQLSFHGGAGIKFEEPDPNDPIIQNRFDYSEGLDVFSVKGEASLLPKSVQISTNVSLATNDGNKILLGSVNSSGDNVVFANDGISVLSFTDSTSTLNVGTNVAWGGSASPEDICTDGTNYYIASRGAIYEGTLDGGAGTEQWTFPSGAQVRIAWLKQRLVAGWANKLYELTGVSTGAVPADGDTGHIYTHPNDSWVWTDFAEAPSAILASGYAGSTSSIYKIGLTTGDGSVPTLSDPVVVAELPAGELVYSLIGVLGAYVVIGTSKGVRVAVVDDNGNLQFGPLVVETAEPVYGLASRDRFIYFTWTKMLEDGTSGVGVIDLGQPTEPGRFAYATHLSVYNTSGTDQGVALDPTGTVHNVAFIGTSDRLCFMQGNTGELWFEAEDDRVPTAKLRTGRIRFHTLEPKLFKFLRPRAAALAGTVAATYLTSTGDAGTVGGWTGQGDADLAEIAFPDTLGPIEWAQITFEFTRDSGDPSAAPVFQGYQIKALPAQKNQRLVYVPVYLFDHEVDRRGTAVGYDGYAWERLSELEKVEEGRNIILFQDLTRYGAVGRQVVIDDITFQQVDPPHNFNGFGGLAVLTLRTVT